MENTLDQDNPKFVSSDMLNAKNRKEWVRIQSFSSFPSWSIDISLLLLARAGFYYTGIYAECRCFSCGKFYKKWKDGDNPYMIHRKISPNCSYMNGIESGNVPVHETDGDRPEPFTYATPLTTVSDAGQEETVGVPDSARREVMVKLQNIDQEEKLQSKGDKRESQDDSRRMRRQYDEDTSSSTTDTRLHKSNTNGAERLARQNGDDNVQRNVDTSGMVDDQIDHQQITTSCTTDDCPLPNNILLLKPTDSNNSYALTDETYKEAEIQKQMVRKYFETIDYKGLTTVHKNLFCNDNLYQSLYVYPVQGELNDTPRAIPIDHPGDNTYLSASGNQVCHPEEEQVSNRHTIHTDVQANNALAEARQLNGPRPIPGIHDMPILLANHGTSGYQDTCPLDPGLMILGYQMKINPDILTIFTGSSHSIFNRELPSIFNLFMARKYEELRRTWAEIIGWTSNSFYGCDGDVMMPPFHLLINFNHSYECSNITCPLNRREFCIPAMRLRCPQRRFLDSCKLQQLINDFTCEIINPCCEPIHHTRPDATGIYQVNASFYSESRCSGTCTTHRIVQTSPEQPPMVILNMAWSRLTRGQIGNINDTVRIGDVHYYIGGITFAGNQHYTGIIILPQQNLLLFYDNFHGINVIDAIHQGPASDVLSLIYLFRER